MSLSAEEQAELESFRQSRVTKAKEAKDAADRQELEVERLAAKCEADGKVRGKDFEIIVNPFGVFAVRAPDDHAILTWENASSKKKDSADWLSQYLRHYIISDDKGIAWATVGAKRPGLVYQTGNAFLKMMGAVTDESEKK